MALGILFNIGESLASLGSAGQDKRLIDYYLKTYLREFKKVYLFSYAKEHHLLPENSLLIPNRFKLHRFIYAFLMPLLHFREFKECEIFRVTHLLGSIPAIIAKVFYGKKFIVTYGYDYKKFSKLEGKGRLSPLISIIEFLNFKLADGIIVTNKQIQDYVSKYIDQEKVFYIPNGVDVRLFKPKSAISNQQSAISKTILFVGRLEKQKNLFTLMKAVSLLKNKEEVLLRFVGDGSLREELKQHAQKLKVNLKIIKRVPHDKMPLVYQGADIFVLPSLIEGHPKVLLEAMACGLFCIVNKIPVLEEIIEEGGNGIFFKNKAEDLVAKMKNVLYVIDKEKIKKIKDNARRLIVKKYNLHKLLDKELRLLKNI